MNTCLIVIDVQESFRHRPFFSEHDLPTYLAAQNALIEGAQAVNMPIVRVFHRDGPAVTSNPFKFPAVYGGPLLAWRFTLPSRRPVIAKTATPPSAISEFSPVTVPEPGVPMFVCVSVMAVVLSEVTVFPAAS